MGLASTGFVNPGGKNFRLVRQALTSSDLGTDFEAGQTLQSPKPCRRGLELQGGTVKKVWQASETKHEKSKPLNSKKNIRCCKHAVDLSCDFLFPLFGFWDKYL